MLLPGKGMLLLSSTGTSQTILLEGAAWLAWAALMVPGEAGVQLHAAIAPEHRLLLVRQPAHCDCGPQKVAPQPRRRWL